MALGAAHSCARKDLQSRHVPRLQTELRHRLSEVFPHLYSIPGKKKTEKWQLLSGPLWLLNSRRLRGLRTGRRAAGPRKRKQQPGCPRKPVATGVCPGLRVKAQVTQSHLMVALPGLGESCPLLVSMSHSPSLPSQPYLDSSYVCRLQGSLSKWSCKPRSPPRPRPHGGPLEVCMGTGKGYVVDG